MNTKQKGSLASFVLLTAWLAIFCLLKNEADISNRSLGWFDPRTIISKSTASAGSSAPQHFEWSDITRDPTMQTASCQKIRGQVGLWLQDMQYGALAQYVTPLKRFRSFPSFVPTPERPFRAATTYKWVDQSCPVHLVTREGMCYVMQELNLNRIHIVGDSLNLQFAQALWKLLGHTDDPMTKTSKEYPQWLRFQYTRTVKCPSGKDFDVAFTRNDLVDGQQEDVIFDKIGDHEFNCGVTEFCLPWHPMYVQHAGNVLLIANTGTHIHDSNNFQSVFDNFMRLIDQRKNPDDVIMFRTTVPGHDGCDDPNVRPLNSLAEFDLTADSRSWDKFAGYNQYATEAIQQQHSRINVLDVTPMTILRKDGHVSGPEKCSTCKEGDCLHYILPGPVDWWVHLAYSNLANLAVTRRQQPS